jgi:uracil-DNA glycosylase
MLSDWKELFDSVKEQEYSKSLHAFLDQEYKNNAVYPPRDMVFQAFKLTKPQELKVVIIGQDPYHNPGQAMGLSFSVPRGIDPPPSLINIYKEIESDLKIKMDFDNGDLTHWAEQGVLLLNAYLTVRAGQALSHERDEYDAFINDVMLYLDKLSQPIVFMLWGTFARKYQSYVRNSTHIALIASHPSPMAANYGGWFGKHLFSQCNDFLVQKGSVAIDWGNI